MQKNLQNFSVAVLGCGGLGCNIAVHLAGSGIGKILLCDFDSVSESNLNRQFLYSADDVGKKKVFLASERLLAYNPRIDITPLDKKIESVDDLDFAKDCDLIFLAVDNNDARAVVSDFCTMHEIVLVNGGVNGFYGTAYLYIPNSTPCLRCAGLLESKPEQIVSVSSTVGQIGALEAELGIRCLLGDTAHGGILFVHDNAETISLPIQRNKDCKVCNTEMR